MSAIYSSTEFTLSRQHPVGVLGWRQDVANLMPHAIDTVLDGERVLVIPFKRDEVKLLSNLGVKAPAPILWRYDWNGHTPFEAQRTTAAMLTTEAEAFVLSDPGTGKTASALWAFDFLYREGGAKKMLVVAPLSTLRQTWLREAARWTPDLRAVVVHGSPEHRRLLLKEDAQIFIINHDGVRAFEKELLAARFQVVCVDELTAFKTATAARSKAMQHIAELARFRWGLTGTPMSRSPEDAHGQVRVIAPGRMPKSVRRWQDRVMIRLSQFKWKPRSNATQLVYEAMQPAVRFTREDIMELPPTVVVRRDAAMSPMQAKVYKAVMGKLRMQVGAGEVTAANEAIKLSKLLQVASGAVITDQGAVSLDPAPRIAAVIEAAEQARGKFIVFAPFIASVDLLYEALRHVNMNVERIYGATVQRERERIFNAFRDDPSMLGIVAHPQTMSHGLTLTEADTIIWAAPVASLETYEQANARITRPGQTRKTMIFQIIGSPVEARVYSRLDDRAQMQGALLDLFAHEQNTATEGDCNDDY